MSNEFKLNIILHMPVKGVVYGIQKGRGIVYETVQKHLADGSDILFECTVQAKPGKDTGLSLLGPFVQGTPNERFIYIDIGTYAGQKESPWSRKIKVPLAGITELILNSPGANAFQTTIPGTGKDGTPTCATVKPFNGWKLLRKANG